MNMEMKVQSVYVEVLNKCNMHCSYCYNNSSKDNLSQMDMGEFFKIIELMKKYECTNIWISGGEPFLHPNIKDIIKICGDNCLNLGIATNGSCVANFITDICESNPSMQISIDSTDRYLNDKYRGEKAFESAMKAVEALNNSSYSGMISIKSTLYDENSNSNSINDMIKFCEKNHINDVFFSPCFSQGRAENKNFLDKQSISFDLNIGDSSVNVHYSRPIHTCELLGDVVNTPLNLRITPAGDVYPCHHLPYMIFNCFDDVDDFIINESLRGMKHNIEELLSHNINCVSCVCKKVCKGGCPAIRIHKEKFSDSICDDIKRDYINKITKIVDGVN